MGKEAYAITGTVDRKRMVDQIRKAARQFAMQYFHFCKTLYERYGHDVAKDIIRQTIHELAIDRTDQIRAISLAKGKKADNVTDFMSDNDLPFEGWIPEWGEDHCPYAETWRTYFNEYPWFKEFATFYCDVIDTSTIENYSKCLSHRITQNVLCKGTCCKREYFESEDVKEGRFTYGS